MSTLDERSDTDPPTRDELLDKIEWLEDGLSTLQLQVFEALKPRLEELEQANEELREENRQLRERLDAVEATSEQALTVASGRTEDDKSQTDMAYEVTRDELIRRAALNAKNQSEMLDVSDVRDLVDREYGERPAWSVIDRAWSELLSEWPTAFAESYKRGNKALTFRRENVRKALARTVERSLDRDDLAKQFVGSESVGGGSE